MAIEFDDLGSYCLHYSLAAMHDRPSAFQWGSNLPSNRLKLFISTCSVAVEWIDTDVGSELTRVRRGIFASGCEPCFFR